MSLSPDAPPALVPVQDLFLDPKNPRLVELDVTIEDQDEIARVLWTERAVDEIAASIEASGYWQHEELFAVWEDGRRVVIEGNRRLAALKLLLDTDLRDRVGASGLPALSDERRDGIASVPVVMTTREEQWRYVGFKHVNGPQDWDSLAKAKYIADVHNDFGIPLPEIARTIGDKNQTVRRLYRGLMVLEQAEAAGEFHRDDRFNKRFAYSHLWTGIGLSGIQSYLGLDPEGGFEPNPVPLDHVARLGEVCQWMYGSRATGERPLVVSQNPDLRRLNEVLLSEDGIAALRNGEDLATALKISQGDDRLFREAVLKAEQGLRAATSLVLTGYDGDVSLAKKVENLVTLATRVREDVQRLRSEPTPPTV